MNELKKKGDALPNWMAEHFHGDDILNAIKRHLNPYWGGRGSGETLPSPTIGKQKYSWGELKRTPKGILAVLAWELGVRKFDFKDATTNEFEIVDGSYSIKKTNKLNEIMLSTVSVDEEE